MRLKISTYLQVSSGSNGAASQSIRFPMAQSTRATSFETRLIDHSSAPSKGRGSSFLATEQNDSDVPPVSINENLDFSFPCTCQQILSHAMA
jgi:hypothetical protein